MSDLPDLRSLDSLDLASFAPHCGETFDCSNSEGVSALLQLEAATDLGSTPRQEQFSLIFTGPRQPAFQQGLHHLRHATFGRIELFLVPLQPLDGQRLYQAIFNRLRD